MPGSMQGGKRSSLLCSLTWYEVKRNFCICLLCTMCATSKMAAVMVAAVLAPAGVVLEGGHPLEQCCSDGCSEGVDARAPSEAVLQ